MAVDRELGEAIAAVARALGERGVAYFITGSVASSVHGDFRATNDVDIVARLTSNTLGEFLAELENDFVADLEQARESIDAGHGFNLIHRTSYLKVDVFPMRTAFDEQAAKRAVVVQLPGLQAPVFVASTEDILLYKLRWYRLGGEVSEVQRRDIAGLIKLNRSALDTIHLRKWSAALGVTDLLEHALD